MTNHAVGIGTCTQSMTIPSYLPSEMHLQKIPDQTEFQSGIVNFQAGVCAKAKNLALVLQWIKRSKQPAPWRASSIQNQLREKNSLIMKNWIWWWRQKWNGAAILLIWSTNLPTVEPWQDKKGKNSYTERKTGEGFLRKTIGYCSRRDTCSFLYMHAAGDRETTWEENGRRKKISSGTSILFSTESEETDWRERLEQFKGQSCDSSKKSLVYGGQDEEDRHVILDIIPCVMVTSLETGAFVASVAYIDMLMVRSNPVRDREKKVLKEQLLLWERKNFQGCVSQNSDPMNSILRKAGELRLNASAGHTMKFSGCTWYKTKIREKKAIWRHYPKRWTSWAKSLRAWFWRTTTWGNLTTRRLYQQSSVEIVEKYASSKPKTTTFYSLMKAPETQKIECLIWIRELQCTMLSKENLSSDAMDTLRRSKIPWATYRGRGSANKRVSTSFCSWSRSVRNSAITLWNACDSIASSALHKTRIFTWVENGVTPQLAQNEKTNTCTVDNSVLLVVSRLSSYSSTICLQHRDQRSNLIIPENWEHYQIQQRLEVTSMHAWNRCW